MNKFQIILLSIFGFFIVAGVIAFATFRGGSNGDNLEPITIWGTISQQTFNSFFNRANAELGKGLRVTYVAFPESEFESELIEGLAADKGPDAIFLSQDLIARQYDKAYVIPQESLSERDFKDRFIEEGELFLTPQGALGLPFMIDPLVLYWNRTLFSNAGLSQPPVYWDELFELTQTLTDRDDRGNIFTSTIAFGEFRNINNAKEILAVLTMQAGNPIVSGTPGNFESVLTERFGKPEAPADSALRFYTEFANPVKSVYSWNPSLPPSQEAFLAGDVALYVGFASELFELQEKNPNLNYDVAMLPQVRDSGRDITFGQMYALVPLKSSPKLFSAIGAIGLMTGADMLEFLEAETGLPPVRRDMLVERPAEAFRSTFYDSALIADAFYDPDPDETEVIFRAMVEDVTSGRERISIAVRNAQEQLSRLFR